MSILVAVDLDDPLAGVRRGTQVEATETALDLLGDITNDHGPVALLHMGQAFDGTGIICVPHEDDILKKNAVRLGDVLGTPLYVAKYQNHRWMEMQCVVDVINGHGGMFSLDSGKGRRFFTRCRLLTASEQERLDL